LTPAAETARAATGGSIINGGAGERRGVEKRSKHTGLEIRPMC